ncbi:Os09g0418800, partial [Oryza sativa Japonica Group]
AVEEVVGDVVPIALGGLGADGGLLQGLVVDELVPELRLELLVARLADVVEDAAGAEHDGEVLELHLRALLEARPPRLESRERVDGDAPEVAHPLVEGVDGAARRGEQERSGQREVEASSLRPRACRRPRRRRPCPQACAPLRRAGAQNKLE